MMFPTIHLSDVTPAQRAELQRIHASHAAGNRMKLDYLWTLIRKSRRSGTALYAGTVPAATKVRRRAANKAARAARRAAR